jgi:glycosyltransferase involved in cell wall biosynthesis
MFSDNFYPEISGISDSLIESARELSGLGHEIDFYVANYKECDYKVADLPFEELDLGPWVKIHRLPSVAFPAPTNQGRAIIPTFLTWLAMREHRPDIIHTHLFFGAGMEALAASRALSVPLVGTSHTPVTEFVRYSPIRGAWSEKVASKFVAWYYNRCIFVTAPSQGILDEMKATGFRRPCRVISNPIDLAHFVPAEEGERERLKAVFGLSDFTVLYTGRLAEEKHIDVIIRAVAQAKAKIPQITLAVTGHGNAEASLRQLAESLGVAESVKFFGTLPVEEHARIYRAADVFAIASTAETQSLSLMKAFASGIPAIGVNARALPEYIHEDTGFIVEPGDFEAMAEKIVFLHDHPEKRAELGKGGIALVSHFSPARIASEWVALYKETISAYKERKQ